MTPDHAGLRRSSPRSSAGHDLSIRPPQARFEPTTEVTLDELRIELTYPQNPTADRFFRETPDRGQRMR